MSRRRVEPILDVIAKLKDGVLNGRSLSAAARRDCVECLTTEGISVPEIAQLLNWTERTIQRDRVFIRARNALLVTPSFVNESAGELLREARACSERVRRAARDKNASPSDRIEAERACFEFVTRSTEMLQSLGFLPKVGSGTDPGWHQLSQQAPPELLAEVHRLQTIMDQVRLRDRAPELPPGTSDAGTGLVAT